MVILGVYVLKFSVRRFFLQFKIEFKAVCIYFKWNFPSEWSRVLLSPLLKNRWLFCFCFCFFPLDFFIFFFFFHSIPTRNSTNWWVVGVLLWNCIMFCFRTLITTSQTQNPHTRYKGQRAKGSGQLGLDFLIWKYFLFYFFYLIKAPLELQFSLNQFFSK